MSCDALQQRGKDIAARLGRKHGQRRAIILFATGHRWRRRGPKRISCAAYLGAETTCKFFCASGAATPTVELCALLDRERQVMDVALDAR
jgi:hypothetical protein